MMRYDFVAIGDVVTDAFIRIADANAEVRDGKLSLGYGDKIPFERAHIIPAVGNSANAAVAAARLGLETAFVSNIGDDRAGDDIITQLKKESVDASFVHRNQGVASNYHYVLWYKDDRTILIKHEQYSYHLPVLDEPKWIYFSSVGEHADQFHDEVATFMRQHPDSKLAFQPGTFQIKLGTHRLRDLYKKTELFFCNREEAMRILEIRDDDIANLVRGMHHIGPKIVVITDGPKGAYTSDGTTIWYMRPYPDPKPPYERTGAGDAFSSTFTTALALGMSLQDAMRWAPINSMSVVQYVGAQEGLLRRSQLEKYLAEAPADYQPKEFAKLS
ncbi:MAG: carbohydrate kinase family protein [Candidatus Ryanbacteria bacterium]|nr:carbohydrate kinase family protein [Candidatus Ryanbacteria bacterium]